MSHVKTVRLWTRADHIRVRDVVLESDGRVLGTVQSIAAHRQYVTTVTLDAGEPPTTLTYANSQLVHVEREEVM